MRVFVTGASGFVGSAVVPELHRRRPRGGRPGSLRASAAAVEAAGAEVHGAAPWPTSTASAPAPRRQTV